MPFFTICAIIAGNFKENYAKRGYCMLKMVILEGLPNVGKTTIINKIKSLNLDNVYTVDEIIKPEIINNFSEDETEYMKNDEMKLSKYKEGLIIIDRGPISTLSYNQTNSIINKDFNARPVIDWFENLYQKIDKQVKIIYLKRSKDEFYIPYENDKDAFGNIENQKLLEGISIYNCKKYFKNTEIRLYDKNDMEDLIDEIIN